MSKYLKCHELLAVDVINDILDSELKKYIYISFQNILNKHYDVIMDIANEFKLKNCFSKKTMSQDLDKITFSSEFKSCVEKFYRLLQKSDCETLIIFGKLMNTVPHEKKSAAFLIKLRKLIQTKQKGGKVIINGATTTQVDDGIIQGMGIKGAVSSFLKNIVDYENPGKFDASTQNLFRMLHTLYSSNMNIFVIVMAKIMKQLYGTSFQYANGKDEEFKMDHYEPKQNARKAINDADKNNYGEKIFTQVTPSKGGYYKTLEKMMSEKKEKNKESVEELINRGERRILELIMKETEKNEDIEKMEDYRIKAMIALSKPNKSRIEELIKTKQSGGNMIQTDNANFEIIYEKYGPWADKIINDLNKFVVELNNNPGFISLSNKFQLSSIDGAVETLGNMISEALIAPTIYMDMATGVMSVFNDNFNSAIQSSNDETESQNKKIVDKFHFYEKNINEFVDVLVDIISKLNIPDDPEFEEYKKKQEKITDQTSGVSSSSSSSSFSSKKPSEKPLYKIPENPQEVEPTGPKTLKNLIDTKRSEYESKVYDILNRKPGHLPPEEKRLSILLHLYDLSSKIKKDIEETQGDQGDQGETALQVNIIENMPKITKSMEDLKTYLIANRASIMDTKWDDQMEITAAKAKLATNEESRANAKSQVKQMLRNTQSTMKEMGKKSSQQYSDFKRQLATKKGGGDPESIGDKLAVAFFNAVKSFGYPLPTREDFKKLFDQDKAERTKAEQAKQDNQSQLSKGVKNPTPKLTKPNGAFVMITYDNNCILVYDTTFDDGKGKWTFPGGGCEKNDSLPLTASKELFEETKGLILIGVNIFQQAEKKRAYKDVAVTLRNTKKREMKRCYYINITIMNHGITLKDLLDNYKQGTIDTYDQSMQIAYNETTNICAYNIDNKNTINVENRSSSEVVNKNTLTKRSTQAIDAFNSIAPLNVTLSGQESLTSEKIAQNYNINVPRLTWNPYIIELSNTI